MTTKATESKMSEFELTRVNDVFADFNAQLAVVKKENEQEIPNVKINY